MLWDNGTLLLSAFDIAPDWFTFMWLLLSNNYGLHGCLLVVTANGCVSAVTRGTIFPCRYALETGEAGRILSTKAFKQVREVYDLTTKMEENFIKVVHDFPWKDASQKAAVDKARQTYKPERMEDSGSASEFLPPLSVLQDLVSYSDIPKAVLDG